MVRVKTAEEAIHNVFVKNQMFDVAKVLSCEVHKSFVGCDGGEGPWRGSC